MASKKRPAIENEEKDVTDADDRLDEYVAEILRVEQATGLTDAEGGKRVRDWRDVEKYHEVRELRRQIEDAFWLEEDAAFNNKHHGRH